MVVKSFRATLGHPEKSLENYRKSRRTTAPSLHLCVELHYDRGTKGIRYRYFFDNNLSQGLFEDSTRIQEAKIIFMFIKGRVSEKKFTLFVVSYGEERRLPCCNANSKDIVLPTSN
jgi:hypothetical protein